MHHRAGRLAAGSGRGFVDSSCACHDDALTPASKAQLSRQLHRVVRRVVVINTPVGRPRHPQTIHYNNSCAAPARRLWPPLSPFAVASATFWMESGFGAVVPWARRFGDRSAVRILTGRRRRRTRNSSDETANVNFLYGDIVHVLQSTAPSPNCTTRRSYNHRGSTG